MVNLRRLDATRLGIESRKSAAMSATLKSLIINCETSILSAFPSSKISPKIRSLRFLMCLRNATTRKATTLFARVLAATRSSSSPREAFASPSDQKTLLRKSSFARSAKATSSAKRLYKGKRDRWKSVGGNEQTILFSAMTCGQQTSSATRKKALRVWWSIAKRLTN